MEGAIVSFFTTVVKLMPAGVNQVIATEPIPNGSNDTSILLFTPSTPQLWNLTAQVQAIQTSGAGQLVSMATQNFTIPVGIQPATSTPSISSVTNQTSTTAAAVTELVATTITSTQTTTMISSINPYLQLTTTILVAALVVTLFVLRNSRKKPEDIP